MYLKTNARTNTVTLCKLIFDKSNKNLKDFNWIYNKNNGFYYNICNCNNISFCKSKLHK